MSGTGDLARLLLASGAPVDGDPADRETPLMTAASYGDADVARVLVDAGASLEAVSSPDAGGVPRATALQHAAVFGMTDVLDVLLAAGARVGGLTDAAAAGDVSGRLRADTPLTDRILALAMAADHQRLDVIDVLLDSGVPVDAEDEVWGRQALRLAAGNGRPRSVRHLLDRGADPDHRDPRARADRARVVPSGALRGQPRARGGRGAPRARDLHRAVSPPLSAATFGEVHGHLVAVGLADGAADARGDGQLVGAVAERHEGTGEGFTVDGAGHLHQAPGAEDGGRVGQLDTGPGVARRAPCPRWRRR